DLGAKFDLNLFRVDVLIVLPVMMEVSVFIQEARNFVGRSYGTPAVINSLAGYRQMQSEVRVMMRFRVVSDLREPRAGHHHARRVDRSRLQGFYRRGVHRVSLAQIVGMNNDQLRPGRISKTVRQRLRRGCYWEQKQKVTKKQESG